MKTVGARVLKCQLDRGDWTWIRLLAAEGCGHQIENVLQEAHDGSLFPHARFCVVGGRFGRCDASRDLLEPFRIVEDRYGRSARRPEAVDERE